MNLRQYLCGCALAWLSAIAPLQAAPFVAGGSEWRPFSYADETGELHGVSIDIARRILQLSDVDVRFVSYPVNRLQAMLSRDQIDLNYADSPQWNSAEDLRRFQFSIPYMNVREHLYFLAGNPLRDKPLEHLQGMTVGMVRGYTYRTLDPAFADNRLSKLEVSQDTALLSLLQSGRVDAVAMVDDLFDYLIVKQRVDPAAFGRGALLSDAPLGIKVQPEHADLLPRINAAIKGMVASGEVERIRKSYLPIDQERDMACDSGVGCSSVPKR
jgi:ABC-type amino acid transport substrate-binding protein